MGFLGTLFQQMTNQNPQGIDPFNPNGMFNRPTVPLPPFDPSNPFALPSVPNPNPFGGVNPYGTQVSGGNTNPWAPSATGATYRPPDPNALTPGGWSFGGTSQNGLPAGMTPRPPDPNATGDVAGPYAQQQAAAGVPGWRKPPQLKAAPQQPLQGQWSPTGGIGMGGPFGMQWETRQGNNNPWQIAPQGSPNYMKGGQ